MSRDIFPHGVVPASAKFAGTCGRCRTNLDGVAVLDCRDSSCPAWSANSLVRVTWTDLKETESVDQMTAKLAALRPGFEFIGELPGKPTAMTTWRGMPIICIHDGPPRFVQRNDDGSFTITPITTKE